MPIYAISVPQEQFIIITSCYVQNQASMLSNYLFNFTINFDSIYIYFTPFSYFILIKLNFISVD